MRNRGAIAVVCTFIGGALLAVACGGDDDDNVSADAGSSTSSSSSTSSTSSSTSSGSVNTSSSSSTSSSGDVGDDDAGNDAGDAGDDSGDDASADAGNDAGNDAGTDAGDDAGDAGGADAGDAEAGAPTVPTPTFTTNPATGPFTTAVDVTIHETDATAAVYYTLDGTTPTPTTSFLYSGPIHLTSTTTVKADAFALGLAASDVATLTVTITPATPTLDPPQFNPTGTNTQNNAFPVALSDSNASAKICFTTDGVTAPTCNQGVCTATSTQYNAAAGGIPITTDATTVQALACLAGATNSQPASQTYHLQVAPVTATGAAALVTLSTNTTSATIHHTTDGSTATCQSTATSTTFSVAPGTTVSAIGCRNGFQSSGVSTFTY